MASIKFRNVTKTYPGDFTAVKGLNLEIRDKEFIVFVGPSGCGKSTTLRMIAGLEDISEGELYIGDELVNEVEPKDRDIAMVFQNYALYPHMTVYKNMAFGLELRKTPRKEIRRKVEDAAKILGIEEMLGRKPKSLSGGQKQRVALGRAMVRNPSVFLLDEPLSNLDAKLRMAMRSEIIKLHKRLGSTFVYVTHDQIEAMTMGDRIVVMKDGLIQQVDSPQNLYDNPVNMFVAGFIGSPQMNFLPVVIENEGGRTVARFGETAIGIPEDRFSPELLKSYAGKEAVLGIRPENLHVHHEKTEGTRQEPAVLDAVVDLAEQMGSETYLYLTSGPAKLTVKAPPHVDAKEMDRIRVDLDRGEIHLFDKDTAGAVGR